MRTSKELASYWEQLVCFKQITESPSETVDMALKAISYDALAETLAAVAKIKSHDGRIYGTSRDFVNSIEVDPVAVMISHDNALFNAGLDNIHPTHIDQIIKELIKRKEN